MALGTYTHLRTSQAVGSRTVRFTLQLTSGANHVEAGSALDLSAATRGAYNGFPVAVDGVKFCGWSTDPGGDSGIVPAYVRAAAGAPATGVLRLYEAGADGAPLDTLPANFDASGYVAVFEASGV